MSTRYLLDLSRLLYRADRTTPTGIDRVELAYARWLLATCPDRLAFCATTYDGRLGPLGFAGAARLVGSLEEVWRRGEGDAVQTRRLRNLAQSLRVGAFVGGERALFRRERRAQGELVYLLVSHHHLDRPRLIERLKRATGARFACFVHDLIPMEFPEYARPKQAERHRLRMLTAADHAEAVIFNSRSTARVFHGFLTASGRGGAGPRTVAAPLGVDIEPSAGLDGRRLSAPYFVSIATIEPKKNHLLLLNVWRNLAQELGSSTPRLVLVGQRGWENENVIDMIERCPSLQPLVEEHGRVDDAAMQRLIAGARAVLMPSFAEGYGLPVAEALAIGAPVLCSDLAAFREVGGDVPEYLDPLDGPGWRQAIIDYAQAGSPRREGQLRRLASWTRPDWTIHFQAVRPLLEGLAGTGDR